MQLDFCPLEYDNQSRWCHLPIALDILRNVEWATPDPEAQLEFQPSTWVQLLKLPNPFSFGEALLLCQYSQNYWIAWVPDHGEILLHRNWFCVV